MPSPAAACWASGACKSPRRSTAVPSSIAPANFPTRAIRMRDFMELPAEELLAPVRGWLRDSGNFSAVTEAGSALKPDTLVEISVSRLFGDFRQPEHPAAVLTMQFVFFDAPNGVPGKVILQKDYSRRMPLDAPTAAALMDGWNQALAEILAEVSADFRHSKSREQVR